VRMRFGFSFASFVISFVLLFVTTVLTCSVARLPRKFFEVDDDAGKFGSGKI